MGATHLSEGTHKIAEISDFFFFFNWKYRSYFIIYSLVHPEAQVAVSVQLKMSVGWGGEMDVGKM